MVCIEFLMNWSHDLTFAGLWYLIPEIIFGSLLLLWMVTAGLASYRREPACTCYRAVTLYLDSGVPVNLDPKLLRRIPVFIGRALILLFLLTSIPSLYFMIVVQLDLRARLMHLVCTTSGLFGIMQTRHTVCSLFYTMAALQLAGRQLQDAFDRDGLEARDHGPVDMTPYRRPITDLERAREDSCAICTDCFSRHEEISALPCGHMFHEVCAESWIRRAASCPLCRTEVAVNRIPPESVAIM